MIEGIFKEECKRRFLALVEINGKEEECYMSTSSKLKDIIDLNGRTVLLKENKGENLRTKYTVQAVKEKENIILLNLNYINELFYAEILKSNQEILREQKINKNAK